MTEITTTTAIEPIMNITKKEHMLLFNIYHSCLANQDGKIGHLKLLKIEKSNLRLFFKNQHLDQTSYLLQYHLRRLYYKLLLYVRKNLI